VPLTDVATTRHHDELFVFVVAAHRQPVVERHDRPRQLLNKVLTGRLHPDLPGRQINELSRRQENLPPGRQVGEVTWMTDRPIGIVLYDFVCILYVPPIGVKTID